MKYRDPYTGDFVDMYLSATDTLPVGTIIDYDGTNIPAGWEEYELPEDIYSDEEVETGEVWIDNKPIYRKTFEIETNPGMGGDFASNMDHEIENVSKIWIDVDNSYAWGERSALYHGLYSTAPHSYPNDTGSTTRPVYGLTVSVNTTKIKYLGNYQAKQVAPTVLIITVLYTKTTD